MSLSVGYDAGFGVNEFGQPKITSEIELVKNVLLTVLFMKPGQFPSLPMIGMNIEDRLYNFYDEINVDGMKQELIQQCAALGVYLNEGYIQFKKKKYKGQPSMLIQVHGQESYPKGYLSDTISNVNAYQIGITYDHLKNLLCDIQSFGGET